MTLLVQKRLRTQLEKVHLEADLALRLERGEASSQMRIRPSSPDEPVSVRFQGRAGLKSSAETFEGAADLVVTRLRLLLLVKSGINSPGLSQRREEFAIVSVDRADLGPPEVIRTLRGKIKRVEFPGMSDSFVIQVPHLPNFDQFLEVM